MTRSPDALILSRTQYRDEYLASPHWRRARRMALERAGNRCQVCNGPDQLDVHHRTYDRLGHEDGMDLTVLCRPCHNLFHKRLPPLIPAQQKLRKQRAPGQPPLSKKAARKKRARQKRASERVKHADVMAEMKARNAGKPLRMQHYGEAAEVLRDPLADL